MVPRSDKALVPMSAARVRRLRKHLVEMLREAKVLKKAPSPYPPEPTGFAARVARAACALCRGWCCRNGGDDLLDDQTMARVRRDRPQLDAQALLQIYVARVPGLAYRDSCIFHGKGRVRQRGGNCGVVEVATDHAATVAIWFGSASIVGGVSSDITSVCM